MRKLNMMSYRPTQQVIDRWNATSDSYNHWESLGGDERFNLFLEEAHKNKSGLKLVAFLTDELDAHPQILAEEAFDMDQAGQAHIGDSTFSLNTAYALIVGDKVVIPVDGDWSLSEIQQLAPNTSLVEI